MCRVLIVEDNVDTADSFAVLLRIWGHDVKVAYHGSSVPRFAREFRPDVVLLDLGLPGLSGLDVAKQLKRADGMGEVKLVAVTGYVRDEDRQRTAEIGFVAHLAKPVDLDQLQEFLAHQ
jgi:CheY-like chemotaxis protein